MPITTRNAVLPIALALALTSCTGNAPGAPPASRSGGKSALSDAQKVQAIAATLRACSYDGSQQNLQPNALRGEAPADCRDMVARVMTYTGLPQNFVVTAGPVPNAAALIMLDDAQVPRRVIAFNPDFIAATQKQTQGNPWAPVSIMAHEIGHHLSGHTITEGGGRPQIELEADKFSGFVLQKMGASLGDATKAILTFGSETDQTTHPGRTRRADAIAQGWKEACTQAGGGACTAGTGTATAPTTTTTPLRVAKATLPTPSTSAIPLKFGSFVLDETGLLDKAEVASLDRELYKLAAERGVEIVVLVVRDLGGVSANDYAWSMMRQLRVGKLDVGNGAVVVIALEQGKGGAAFGPGIAREMEGTDPTRRIEKAIEGAWAICTRNSNCGNWTDTMFMFPRNIARTTAPLEWTIRHSSMQAFMDTYLADFNASMKRPPGTQYDPKSERAYKTLVRFRGTVVKLDTPVGDPVAKPGVMANSAIVKRGYRAVHLRSEEGFPVVFYVDPKMPGLMPGGPLRVGGDYTFVGRVTAPSPIKGQAQHLWGLSYEPLS